MWQFEVGEGIFWISQFLIVLIYCEIIISIGYTKLYFSILLIIKNELKVGRGQYIIT